jgi:uncharacterized protein YvpB
VSWGPERLDAFARGTDGALWHRWYEAGQWSYWESLGGRLKAQPAVASRGPNRLDVLVRGTNNVLYHLWWDGRAWLGWEDLGGLLGSDPAAVSWGQDHLDVLVAGMNARMYHKWWDGIRWSGWEDQGGVLLDAPGVSSWAVGRLDVFARGSDNGLWHKWLDGSGWSGWEAQGGAATAAPAASSWGFNRIDVMVRGSDNGLWHEWWDGVRWNRWESLGGALTSAPTILSPAAGQLDVFAQGTDLGVWMRHCEGPWDGWRGLALAPSSNALRDAPYYRQVYELSCEEAALQMALGYEGFNVSQGQELNDIGIDWRAAYRDANGLRWGDPYANFVGDPNGSEVLLTGYGTYFSTISRIASAYRGTVLAAGEGYAVQDVYRAALQSHPVVVWVSFDWAYHPPGSWLAFDGRWVQYQGSVEHAVTVVGVNPGAVYLYNPWYGPQWISKGAFEAAYHTYHDMAVVLQ